MTTKDTLKFRSKRERESEIDLVRNYRDIAIPAIAAASSATRKNNTATREAAARQTVTLVAAE
ncbi:hypothetical protein [Jiella sonneratiae]|uniref:Transcriptional regulator n=1 Tax=Jiella sonneratiae TaxID=2816856 RepID=A0ABS3J6K4_9HYPH|nr:hypothetical protein [Jiella sonneratiae]MBO0905293.1 hypothetical protein [Jiella sonneratiae]